jgi:K+ transporter
MCASASWRSPICSACCTRKNHVVPPTFDNATYFSERDYVTGRKRNPRMATWRRRLFAFLHRNAIHPADRFNLPPQNFVQISRQIEV